MQKLLLSVAVSAFALCSCSQPADDPLKSAQTELTPQANISTPAVTESPEKRVPGITSGVPISVVMDCVRENGALPAAHRGGPRRGFPENAIETLQKSYENGTRIFEVDIAESKDGVMFLLHDTDLDRTTTGTGVAREKNWSELKTYKLTANGEATDFDIPTLEAALKWAVSTSSILELDKKRSTSFEKIISEVRKAGAQNNAILITYTEEQAAEVARLAPDMVMTASVADPSDVEHLETLGVKRENLIAWTGTQDLNPGLWSDLKAMGIEVAFGTLGRRGDRFDDQFYEDRDASEYNELVAEGVTLIATDYSDRVANVLTADETAMTACGLN